MTEKTIPIESVNPLEIFGVNDANFELLKNHFPKLKLIARGTEVKAIGEESEIDAFEKRFSLLILHLERFGKLSESDVADLLQSESEDIPQPLPQSNDVLVHGRYGKLIKARTPNQQLMVESCRRNDLLFAIGPAGTGKTYTAVALAVQALRNKQIKRLILTRPAVEAGENLGFLPGDLKDKLDPYLQPLYDALRDMLPSQKLLGYLEDGTIEIAPLAFMRGRTLDNVFAILDEAQNATESQLKMFLTRMGASAKFIVTGDITQIDLPRNQSSGLVQVTRILKDIPGIDFIYLNEKDIIRHKLVVKIINAYGKSTNSITQNKTQNGSDNKDKF
jgi:phosphate starvation-inducible protein PhoH and related proteins